VRSLAGSIARETIEIYIDLWDVYSDVNDTRCGAAKIFGGMAMT